MTFKAFREEGQNRAKFEHVEIIYTFSGIKKLKYLLIN
jgi:hypothetical protein